MKTMNCIIKNPKIMTISSQDEEHLRFRFANHLFNTLYYIRYYVNHAKDCFFDEYFYVTLDYII